MTNRRLILFFFAVLLLGALFPINSAQQAPKNVILLIGDGMGLAQVCHARFSSSEPLSMDSMPTAGFVQTHSADATVTDSAAAGTALATGYKTNNGMISTLPDGKPVRTILEVAEKMGKSTGIVTTVIITDATPAVFGSHVPSRKQQADIAPQYVQEEIEVVLGGGKQFFIPKAQPESKREDGRDLIAEAKSAGYEFVDTREGLLSAKGKRLLGLFAAGSMTTEAPEPSLAEMAEKAISVLSADKDGFFVMIEGGKIDYKCHANDAAGCLKEVLEFDAAVGKALDFARKRDDTLVIVTADHETGGMSITGPDKDSAEKFKVVFSTTGHTAVNVPIFAFGPGAGIFSGVMDNTDVPKRIARLWNVKEFPKQGTGNG
jgi:alkaline phosphatase